MNLEDIHSRNIDVENRTIYLYGDALVKDEEPGVDYRMANSFMKNMDIIARTEGDINISMGTIGGDWNYGMAIYDKIKACPRKTIITAYAWARSMSSIILQAATERILMPHCDFMVHYGTMSVDGYYLSAKSSMEFTILTEEQMLRIYAERCIHGPYFQTSVQPETPYTIESVMKFIDNKMKEKGDWWMTAKMAVDYGFADKIAELS